MQWHFKALGFCGTELSNLQLSANIITILTGSCSIHIIIITDDFILPLYMELDMLLLLEIIIFKLL